MKSLDEVNEKCNMEHPIVNLEEKVRFLTLIREMLVTSPERCISSEMDHVSDTDEQIEQYKLAIKILRKHHEA